MNEYSDFDSCLFINNITLNQFKIPSKNSCYYYTKVSTANAILNSNSLWATPLCKMNDLDEGRYFSKAKRENAYGICFCKNPIENIQLWYLYSGITGEGVRLGFNSNLMNKMIDSFISSTAIVTDDNGNSMVLGKDCDIAWSPVFYVHHTEKKGGREEKISYLSDNFLVKNEINESADASHLFVKNSSWKTEKEFRIVIINKTGKPIEHFIVKFPGDFSKLVKIRFGPGIVDGQSLKNVIAKYSLIQSLIDISKKNWRSILNINMDILNKQCEIIREYLQKNPNSALGNEIEKEICKKDSFCQFASSSYARKF